MKRLLTVSLALFIVGNLTAQFKGNEFGVSYNYGKGKVPFEGQDLILKSGFYGFTWYPKYILTETEKTSISVGSPFTLGLSAMYNMQGDGEIRIGVDLPLMVDYNFGFGAIADDAGKSGLGGFVGGGFGYTRNKISDWELQRPVSPSVEGGIYLYEFAQSYGPMLHAGMRIPLGQDGLGITVRFAYKKGLEEEKFNFYTGSILFRFK